MLPVQGATGVIPGQGPKIPQVAQHGQKKKKRPRHLTELKPHQALWDAIHKNSTFTSHLSEFIFVSFKSLSF